MRLAVHAGHRQALSPLHVIFLVAAGVLAGIVGTAGGITSLVSYPALLAVGLPPLTANATNIVALVACWPGSAHGSQRELAGWGPWLKRWLPLSAAGGTAGAVLLLVTPSGAFARAVPFLIAASAVTLIAEPWISGLRPSRGQRIRRHRTAALVVALALLGTYGGYFGAGSGVMTLALLLIMVDRDLPSANALKNMINGAVTLPAGVLLAILGPVHWAPAAALAAGALVGSRIGPVVTRWLPTLFARWAIATLGLGLAVWLWVKPSA
ncbi:MAG TPA: sulfite exporter TauE/SafE family protein [Solirubrobacteraceae bacterium]|nr:sulfite exporter TauE/SafE family protein [Solirubrobacteraceae bacterium]